jgi:hypothetical protein
MKALGKAYKDAEASTGDFKKLPEGGYIVKILEVKDQAAKEYLDIVFDIAEGEYKDFYSDEWGKAHPYAHNLMRSYKETALGMFKGFLRTVDQSNGTSFEAAAEKGLKEQQLVGKILGVVIGSEEYETNRGEVKTRLYVKTVLTAEKIRQGDFTVPELKKLESRSKFSELVDGQSSGSAPEGFQPFDDGSIPF